jgi:hypothetical protein
MTIPRQPTLEHRGLDASRRGLLADIYGSAVPEGALRLDCYLRRGRLPLRDPDQPSQVLAIDVAAAAEMFGAEPADTDRHVHYLYATGRLRLDRDGVVIVDDAKADEFSR